MLLLIMTVLSPIIMPIMTVEYDESEDDKVERERNGEYYFEQLAANESCRERAVSDMQLIRELRVSLGLFDHQPWFERNAWLTIVKCRRVLKWAYAYQYYHAEDLANMKLLEFLHEALGIPEGSCRKDLETTS